MNTNQIRSLRATNLDQLAQETIRDAGTRVSVREVVVQSAHGFAVGDWVYLASGSWAKADRDAAASLAHGVVSLVVSVDEFEVATSGVVNGLSGLTADTTYYLSSTAGAMIATVPTSGVVQVLGISLSTTSFRVCIQNTNLPILLIAVNDAGTDPRIILEQSGAGDASLRLLLTGGQNYIFGIDNSDNDRLKLSAGADFGTNDALTIDTDGDVGIATTAPSQAFDVNDDSIRVRTSKTPASASATGTQGQIAWDSDYIYVCTATDTWKRVAIATWV